MRLRMNGQSRWGVPEYTFAAGWVALMALVGWALGELVVGAEAHAAAGSAGFGIYPFKTSRTDYSGTTVGTSAFVTLVTSTDVQTTEIELADTGGQTMVVAWAASCATLSASANAILIAPNVSGSRPVYIPPATCVGVKAVSAQPSTGELDITFFR